jgi:glutaredoxin 2
MFDQQLLAIQQVKNKNIQLIYNEYCPFCIKTQIAAGYIGIEKINIQCGDSSITIPLIGRHQVPILKKDDGTAMMESLDICNYLNDIVDKRIFGNEPSIKKNLFEIKEQINEIFIYTKNLISSLIIDHPLHKNDFATSEAKAIYKNRISHLKDVNRNQLQEIVYHLEELISVNYNYLYHYNHQLSWEDLDIFPLLRMISILDGVYIDLGLCTRKYLVNIANICSITLY